MRRAAHPRRPNPIRCSPARVLSLSLSAVAVDEPNVKLQSPLHFAAFKKMPGAVAQMLAAGADPFVLDHKGRTPAEDTSDEAIKEAVLAAQEARLAQWEAQYLQGE